MSASYRMSLAACLAAVAALSLGAFGLSRPDGLIERSFADAFGSADSPQHRVAVDTAFDPSHLHLSSLPAFGMASPAMAIGDRITLAQRHGGAVAYEVVEIRPLPGNGGGDGATDQSRLMLVTAISTGQLPARSIRFVVDAATSGQGTASKPRTL